MQDELIDNCKTSKLYDIGLVQSYGALLAIDVVSGSIIACSENIKKFMGFDEDQLLGKNWDQFLDHKDLHILLDPASNTDYLFWQITINNRELLVSGHSDGITAIIEMEPYFHTMASDSRSRTGFMHDLVQLDEPEQVATFLMEGIAKVTDFDRVMLYRFRSDWHGFVLAEKLKLGVEGFLNLHFPAGDIPENARRLYTINLQRYVADTAVAPVGIVGVGSNPSLDLTYSQLRAVHPVHIQYLENIGARSSFSISIVAEGKLWGMVACHNLEPRNLGFEQRFFCEEMSRMASLRMTGLLALTTEKFRSVIYQQLARVESHLEGGAEPIRIFVEYMPQIMTAFDADSIILRLEDKSYSSGAISAYGDLSGLEDWISEQDAPVVWHSNTFPESLSQSQSALQKFASGLLLISLGGSNYILLLRNEQIENQHWAGKLAEADQEITEMLTPRNSFATWARETSARATPWSEVQIQAAANFSHTCTHSLENMRLEKMAMQDTLTGLPNRRSFETELVRITSTLGKRKNHIALYMMDLDKFKLVNDTLGHAAGDELLRQVGERLEALLRAEDKLARLGGDEFALLQYNVRDSSEVELVADRILEAICQPYNLKAGNAEIGISIGIALYPEHAVEAEELMAKADGALYQVKNSGRNNWRFYAA